MAYCAVHQKTFSDVENCPFCEWEDEEENSACTCDFDEIENCPVHYPIDDGSDDDDCMDCGVCDECIQRCKDYAEEMMRSPKAETDPSW
jgi:hypothetical protein